MAEVIPLPDQSILMARVVIGALLLAMYSYNIVRAYRAWHVDRDWETFRQFIMAFELEFGVLLIFSGYVSSAFFVDNPELLNTIRTFGLGLLGVLIIGGVTLLFSWRKPKELEAR